jgi:hypothetical protein
MGEVPLYGIACRRAFLARHRRLRPHEDTAPRAHENAWNTAPLSSEYGTHKTVNTKFSPWPLRKSPSNISSFPCSLASGPWRTGGEDGVLQGYLDIRKRTSLGLYSGTMLRALWGP